MKKLNTSSPPRLVALLFGAALLGLASQSTLAAGTASNTTISNLAKLSYTVSAVSQSPICSAPGAGNSTGDNDGTCVSGAFGAVSTDFLVDNKVNLTVAKVADRTIIPNSTDRTLRFTVTNNGNTSQRYALSAVAGAENMTGDMSNVRIYKDVNNDGIVDGGDTLYVNAGTFGDIAADASLNIMIVADTAVTPVNGETAVFSLLAATVNAGGLVVTTETAGANTGGVDVVFADIAGSAAGDTARDGDHSVSATYTIGSSILSVAKIVTLLCDPYNGNTNPKNIPGAVVQYAITITNAAGAGASATLSQVTDALSATLAWDPKLISGAGAPAATACTSAGGTQLSATTGFSAVRGTGTTTTTYAAPGAAAQDTTAGATHAAGTVTINFATLAGTAYGAADAVLPANSFVTVYFNAIVQ